MLNPIGWRRASVLDYELSKRTFGWGHNFSAGWSINRKRVEWARDIENRPPIQIDESPHLLASRPFLSTSYRNEQAGEDRQKEGKNGDDSISDLAFAYKLFAPFGWGICAFACAVASRSLYVRTESRVIEAVSFLLAICGPLGICYGLWWWALN